MLLLSLTPQILFILLLRKRLIPPKRSHQSSLKLKKTGVSHQNRAIKKMLQNWKGSNSEFSRLFLFLFIYIWYTDLDSAYPPYCIESCFSFSLNKFGLCAWDTRRWSNNSNFYIFAIQSIPWPSFQTTEVEVLVVGAKNQFIEPGKAHNFFFFFAVHVYYFVAIIIISYT